MRPLRWAALRACSTSSCPSWGGRRRRHPPRPGGEEDGGRGVRLTSRPGRRGREEGKVATVGLERCFREMAPACRFGWWAVQVPCRGWCRAPPSQKVGVSPGQGKGGANPWGSFKEESRWKGWIWSIQMHCEIETEMDLLCRRHERRGIEG